MNGFVLLVEASFRVANRWRGRDQPFEWRGVAILMEALNLLSQ